MPNPLRSEKQKSEPLELKDKVSSCCKDKVWVLNPHLSGWRYVCKSCMNCCYLELSVNWKVSIDGNAIL